MPLEITEQQRARALQACLNVEGLTNTRVSTAVLIPIDTSRDHYKLLATTIAPLHVYQYDEQCINRDYRGDEVGEPSWKIAVFDLHSLLHGAGQAPQLADLWAFSLGLPVKGDQLANDLLRVINDHGAAQAKLHHVKRQISQLKGSHRPLSHIPPAIAAAAARVAEYTGHFGTLPYVLWELDKRPEAFPAPILLHFRCLHASTEPPAIDREAVGTYIGSLKPHRGAGLTTATWSEKAVTYLRRAHALEYPPTPSPEHEGPTL